MRGQAGKRLVALLGAIAVAVAAAWAVTQRFGLDPHGATDKCAACHVGAPPAGARPPAAGVPGVPASYELRYPRERAVCERCHGDLGEKTHPVELAATRRVPAGWPLDAQGRLMCSTCHDPHLAVGASKKTARGHLLRGDRLGADFCQACHGRLGDGDTRAWHVVVTRTAHGSEPDPVESPGRPLDSLSARCLACHDGILGKDAGLRIGARRPGTRRASSHPVGVRYDPVPRPRKSDDAGPRLRPVASLDERLRLFGGKIGCGTCHDPYSRNRKLLVIDPSHGRLCRSCHDL